MSEPQPRGVCGHRETRITGTWECVAAYKHDHGHYYVRLERRVVEPETCERAPVEHVGSWDNKDAPARCANTIARANRIPFSDKESG